MVCLGFGPSGGERTARPRRAQPSAAEAFAPGRPHPADRAGGPREGTAVAPLPASEPVRLRIPQIRVDTPVMRLGLDAAGGLDVPPEGNPNIAGWYRDGTPPGTPGTAVVAGHVDTAEGPAVFYRLGALHKGHTVEVLRKDGRTAVFTIDAIEVYDAADFPDSKVYGKAARPELRVITCGGGFVEGKGYRGNVVVFAHLTGVRAVTHNAAPEGTGHAAPESTPSDEITPPTGRTPASRPA
ncbi:class F sortase [Streptomyces spiroverticillatus]